MLAMVRSLEDLESAEASFVKNSSTATRTFSQSNMNFVKERY
jgi:hypothetical protein